MHVVGVVPGVRTGRIQKPPRPRPRPNQPKPPQQAPNQNMLGQWPRLTYDVSTDTDCAVTYTCKYGRNFDEVSFGEIVLRTRCTMMLIPSRSATISLGEFTRGTPEEAFTTMKVSSALILGVNER
jgi:hypothetical protein